MSPRVAELCAGYTGLGLAIGEVLGGELALVADNDPGASAILAHRFPSVPNYTDITTADWAEAGPVDILAAGFPCQPVSLAGKHLGEADERWIWPSVVRAVRDLRPGLVVLENVSALVVRGLAGVAADLAEIGYVGSWCCLRASDVGAPHRRERVFILAWPAADAADGGRHELDYGSEPRTHDPEPLSRRAGVAGDDRGGRLAPADAECDGLQGRRPAARADAGRPGAASVRCRPADSGPATEDPDRAAGGERRQSASGQAAGGWARADAGGSGGVRAIADAAGQRHRDAGTPGERGIPAAAISGAPADAEGDGRHARRPESARIIGGPDAAERGDRTPADADSDGLARSTERHGEPLSGKAGHEQRRVDPLRRVLDWGNYAPAIHRWEAVLGRPAPRPTEPGRTGERLSPRFVEWMMGLPEGWVTDVPGLSRNAQLKALGNGVVPQQAAAALRLLLERSGLLPLIAADLTSAEGGEAA